MVLNWVLKRSAMTFTFDRETWFKVAAHLLPKSSVYMYVKYETDMAKGRVNMLDIFFFV